MHLHDWFQSLSLVGTMALLGACNGSGGGNTDDTATAASMTGTGTATTGSSGATTGATSTTVTTGSSEPTGSGSVGQTDTGSSGATSPGTTTLETTGATSGMSGSTGETGSSGASTDTGGTMGMPCASAKDCQLADGCCYCDVLGPGQPAPPCNVPECLQTTCSGYNLEQAELDCRWGACTFAKLTCNPLGVICKSLPPNCAPGDVPGVMEDVNGKCWTGSCLPAKACDWVPDCSYCDKPDLVCVLKGQKGAYHVCEPRPLDCAPGDIDCDCGQQICDASPPHTVCHDAEPGIECECPNC